MDPTTIFGFVAIFVQNVMKGELPLSVRRLRGESVELFGRSEALFPAPHDHLSFLDHVHEFDPNQGILGCVERFKPEHRPCHALYCSMVLFHNIIHIFHLTDDDGRTVLFVIAFDGGFIRVAAINRDRLRQSPLPMLNRSYHGHSFSYWVAQLIQAFVVGRQAVTAAEAEAWLQEFDVLEQQGAYFFCSMPILTEAVKVT